MINFVNDFTNYRASPFDDLKNRLKVKWRRKKIFSEIISCDSAGITSFQFSWDDTEDSMTPVELLPNIFYLELDVMSYWRQSSRQPSYALNSYKCHNCRWHNSVLIGLRQLIHPTSFILKPSAAGGAKTRMGNHVNGTSALSMPSVVRLC